MKSKLIILFILNFSILNSNIKLSKPINKFPERESLKKIIETHRGKVIYLDFWASWCKPCRKEIKKMKEIKESFVNKDISFIYISVEGDIKKCNEAITKDGVIVENYMNYKLINDTGYDDLDLVRELPTYMIFNKKGE